MADVEVHLIGLDDVSPMLNTVSAAMGSLASVASAGVELALAAVTAAFVASGAAMTEFISSAVEGENITTAFSFALEKQGAGAAITASAGAKLAEAMRNLAGGNSETVLSAESVLLKFREINSDMFPSALRLSADLAAQMGISMPAAAQMLGKGLENPTTAMRLLKTVGGEVTHEFTKQIAEMVKHGDTAGADALIMAKLNDVIGGKASSAASTLSGEWANMTGNLAEAGRKIGDDFLPVMHQLMEKVIQPGIVYVEDLAARFAQFLSVFRSGDLMSGLTGFNNNLIAMFPWLGNIEKAFTSLYGWLKVAVPAAITELSSVWTDTLLPDIQMVWGWMSSELFPLLGKLQGIIGAGLSDSVKQLGADFAGHMLPDLQTTGNWMKDNILPMLSNLWGWLKESLPSAIQSLVSFWTGTLLPAMLRFSDWYRDVGGPVLLEIGHLIGYVLSADVKMFGNSFDALTTTFSIFTDIFKGNWSDLGTKIQRIWADNWSNIQIVLKAGMDLGMKTIQLMDWHGLGGNIMRSFARGVEDEAYNVVSAIFGAPYRAWEALASQFGMSTGGMNVNLHAIARSY